MRESCALLKRTATQTETNNLLPIEWFKVEYQPSVRHIKDKEVRKNTMEIRLSHRVHADNLTQTIQILKKEGHSHINPIPDIIRLPLKCPVCHEIGSPTINKEKRAKFDDFDFRHNRIKQYKRYLKYNHKNKKNHRIGKYKIITTIPKDNKRTIKRIPCIQLKKGLTRESLGFR